MAEKREQVACRVCGKLFTPRNRRHYYCSAECKAARAKLVARGHRVIARQELAGDFIPAEEPVITQCPVCGAKTESYLCPACNEKIKAGEPFQKAV